MFHKYSIKNVRLLVDPIRFSEAGLTMNYQPRASANSGLGIL
jgi:hypothetical protein